MQFLKAALLKITAKCTSKRSNPIHVNLNQGGFTLIEMMVASVIFITIIAAGSDFFLNVNKSSIVNSQITDTQKDLRLAMLTIARDITMAGYGTTSIGSCPNAITATNSDSAPDTIDIASMNTLTTTLQTAAVSGANTLTVNETIDGTVSINGISIVNVTAGTGLTFGISPPLSLSGEQYPVGTPILTASCTQYAIDPATRQLNRTVNNTTSVLAEGIIDMQLAYALDADGDGLIDDADGSGDFSTGDFVNQPPTAGDIRLVRITLFAQTQRADSKYVLGTPRTLEDHDPTTDAGYTVANYSRFRGRTLSRIVRPRNMGL